eukprot:scaffold319830_cov40-Prasinocladus_malaysianus.AAC.2
MEWSCFSRVSWGRKIVVKDDHDMSVAFLLTRKKPAVKKQRPDLRLLPLIMTASGANGNSMVSLSLT